MWFQQPYRNSATTPNAELRKPTVMSTTIPLSQRFSQQNVRTQAVPVSREPQYAPDPRNIAGRYNRSHGVPVSYADLEEDIFDDYMDPMEPRIQRRPNVPQRGFYPGHGPNQYDLEIDEKPAYAPNPAQRRQEAIRNSIAANLERYQSRGRRGFPGQNFVRRGAGARGGIFSRVANRGTSIPRVGAGRGGRGRGIARTNIHMRVGAPNISRNFDGRGGVVNRGGRGRGISNRGGNRGGQTNGEISKDHLDKELDSYMAKLKKSKSALDKEIDSYMLGKETKPTSTENPACEDNDVSMGE